MKLDDETLRALYQKQTARPRVGAGACPSPESIATALEDRLEREALVSHLAACSDCASEVRSALPLASLVAEAFAEPAIPPSGAAFWTRFLTFRTLHWWRLAASATALAATIGLSLLLWQERRRIDSSGPNGSSESSVYRGGNAPLLHVVPADGARVADPPRTLSWSAAEPGDRYRVLLFDFESTPLWQSPLVSAQSVELPAEVQSRLGGGRLCYWRVVLLRGVRETESELFRFSVGPELPGTGRPD